MVRETKKSKIRWDPSNRRLEVFILFRVKFYFLQLLKLPFTRADQLIIYHQGVRYLLLEIQLVRDTFRDLP